MCKQQERNEILQEMWETLNKLRALVSLLWVVNVESISQDTLEWASNILIDFVNQIESNMEKLA